MDKTSFVRLAFRVSAGTLYARAAGPEDGRVVLFLHGFPEFWYGWRKQVSALAEAGFRAIALDQRGYNESAKPPHVRDYAIAELCGDVLAVADSLGRERICLVGHDWGGIVAWEVAMRYPERIDRMVILNAPHPAAARRYLTTSVRHIARSWYVLFFQLPRLPERFFSAHDFETGVRALTATSAPNAFSPEDLEQYRHAWTQPGAVRGMINWYRALVRHSRAADVAPIQVAAPTRIVWGARDPFLMRELAAESLKYCPGGDLIELAEATHWLQHEEPERVSAILTDWLARQS